MTVVRGLFPLCALPAVETGNLLVAWVGGSSGVGWLVRGRRGAQGVALSDGVQARRQDVYVGGGVELEGETWRGSLFCCWRYAVENCVCVCSLTYPPSSPRATPEI